MVEWDVEVISRLLFLLKWEVSAPALEKRPAEWKGFLGSPGIPVKTDHRLEVCPIFPMC